MINLKNGKISNFLTRAVMAKWMQNSDSLAKNYLRYQKSEELDQ
jgi:hypothetical protein